MRRHGHHLPKRPVVPATVLDGSPAADPITEDLRAFAHDLGVSGCSTMSKRELVESLRQCYVLAALRSAGQGVGGAR